MCMRSAMRKATSGIRRERSPGKRVRSLMTERPIQDAPSVAEPSSEARDIGEIVKRRFRGNGFGFGGDIGLGG